MFRSFQSGKIKAKGRSSPLGWVFRGDLLVPGIFPYFLFRCFQPSGVVQGPMEFKLGSANPDKSAPINSRLSQKPAVGIDGETEPHSEDRGRVGPESNAAVRAAPVSSGGVSVRNYYPRPSVKKLHHFIVLDHVLTLLTKPIFIYI